jgi:chromosome partitioning protein
MTRAFVFTNHKGVWASPRPPPTSPSASSAFCGRQGHPTAACCSLTPTPQAHATLVTTSRKDYGADNSLYTVLMADRQNAAVALASCIVESQWDSDLHVLPASPMLEGAERELMGLAGAPYRLADPLSKIASQYAAVLIDTRPSFSLLTEMALLAASDAIIPVEPRYLETIGLMSVIAKINDCDTSYPPGHFAVGSTEVTGGLYAPRSQRRIADQAQADGTGIRKILRCH